MIKLKLHIKLAENRMSQKQLSERTGVRPTTISGYYNDTCKHLVKEHLDLFCKELNCDISDLIEFVDERK